MSIIVVDDFCEYAKEVVASAHFGGFGTWLPNKGQVGSSVYEGTAFWGDHALMIAPLVNATRSVVVPNTMFFRGTKKDTETAYIHSDREHGDYTAIVYLSEHDEEYGTAFFRHVPTGLLHMPSFEEMAEMGILEEIKEDMVTRDPSKWEQVDYVEGKYNRALIFDAPLFHSRFPVHGIGTTDEEARLVWVSHFFKLHGDGSFI